jgi:hypothetical protein
VQYPASTTIQETLSSGPRSGCPAGSSGWDRNTDQYVLDQFGTPILYANQQLTETYLVNGNANGLQMTKIQTGQGVTNAAGIFGDEYWVCIKVCPSSQTTTATQYPEDMFIDGNLYILTRNTIVYGCSNITFNGH